MHTILIELLGLFLLAGLVRLWLGGVARLWTATLPDRRRHRPR